MKAKKLLVNTALIAGILLSTIVYADVSVFSNDRASFSFYGVLDAAFGTVKHSLGIDSQYSGSVNPVKALKKSISPSSATGFFSGGISGSRIGTKGKINITKEFNTFFLAEQGFNLTTLKISNAAAGMATNGGDNYQTAGYDSNSSLNGQLFNRQALIGLEYSKIGSLAFGRNYAPIHDIILKYDPVQNAQLFSLLGRSGAYRGGGVSENVRVDKSFKYTNSIGPVNFGALYKVNESAGHSRAKVGYALNLGYEQGKFGIQAAYETFKDALKGSSSKTMINAVDVSIYDTKAFTLATKYKITNAATVKAGYETYSLSSPSDYITSISYYSQQVGIIASNMSVASQITDILFIGGDYNFTEKFNLAAGWYNVSLRRSGDYITASATNSAPAKGQASGIQNYYSLLADYHFTSAFDTYAGVMCGSLGGDQYPASVYYTSNYIAAVGARFKF